MDLDSRVAIVGPNGAGKVGGGGIVPGATSLPCLGAVSSWHALTGRCPLAPHLPPILPRLPSKHYALQSTLLKLMTGQLEPLDGMVKRHNHLRIGQYHQHLTESLNGEQTPLEYMVSVEGRRGGEGRG